jgi:hypothetical protein
MVTLTKWHNANEVQPADKEEVLIRVKGGDYNLATYHSSARQFTLRNGAAYACGEAGLQWRDVTFPDSKHGH